VRILYLYSHGVFLCWQIYILSANLKSIFWKNSDIGRCLRIALLSKTQSSLWMQIIFSWPNKSIKIVLKSFSSRKKSLDKSFAFWSASAGCERCGGRERAGATSQLLKRPQALQLKHISTRITQTYFLSTTQTYFYCILLKLCDCTSVQL